MRGARPEGMLAGQSSTSAKEAQMSTTATAMTVVPDAPVASVRKARAEDAGRLARVLARAFLDDPVTEWFLPDPSDRFERLERMYQLIMVPDALNDDEAYVTGDGGAVALWVPAGKPKPGLVGNLRLMTKVARVFGRHAPRALRGLSYMESKFPEQPHAHLVFIGTDPDRQGEGLGSELLRRTLPRLDRRGIPAYLEASTLRSRALYLRHGFVDMDEMRMPDDGPPLWRMWRDPA
jgi:GNAT superfamily N-acetyltransferase